MIVQFWEILIFKTYGKHCGFLLCPLLTACGLFFCLD